ncbi:MAG: hypothetical protein L0H25_05200 [Micrococcales bacterium]|nr:hypothetical protein [Micrococcales bacterium]
MHISTSRIAGVGLAAAATMAISVGPAFAADGAVSTNLKAVPGSGVHGSGTAMVEVTGTTITVTMAATGLLPDQPHAAHIHFGAGARHECPTLSDDTNDDGHLTTTEGGAAYGSVKVSLTMSGDTSAKSALAIDRFDTAPGGKLSYERGSINVAPDVASAIASGESAVVVHGVDYNKNGKYDGATKSDLDPKLPTEATDPALCGVLGLAPTGGMHTGGGLASGDASGGIDEGLLVVGGGALLAAAGTGVVVARRVRARA